MATRGMSVFTHEGTDYTINDPNIAPEFDASLANVKGAYVNYQGDLYRFTAAHTANTAWGSRSKTKVKLAEELLDEITNRETADNGKVPNTRTVNGHELSSDVTVTKSDVGLGNVDNTSDANKPISTATQTALNGKVPTTRKVNGHALSSDVTVTKGDVGLGNVENTADLSKPVSTATQAALDLKVDKANIENDLTGETAGKVLDARQGKVLNNAVSDAKCVAVEARDMTANDSDRTNTLIDSVFGYVDSINSALYKFIDPIGNNEITEMAIGVVGSQTGSGTPAPDNVMPFTFPSSVSVTDTNSQGTTNTKTANLSGIASKVHKGVLLPFEGRFVAEEKKITLNGSNIKVEYVLSGRNIFLLQNTLDLPSGVYTVSNYTLMCDRLQSISTNATWDNYSQFISVSSGPSGDKLAIKPGVTISTVADAVAWLSENMPTVVYTAKEPGSYAIPRIKMNTFYGLNTIAVTNGTIKGVQAFDRKMNEYGSQLKNRNIYDFLASKELAPKVGETGGAAGVNFTTTDKGTIIVNGTADGISVCNLTRKKVRKGQTFHVKLNGGTVTLGPVVNDSANNTIKYYYFSHDGYFTVPNLDTVDNMLIRLYLQDGTEIDHEEVDYSVESVPDIDELNILVFGNSFSYSTLSYVPSLINEILPQLNVNLGILYSSGMDFAGHISKWNEDGAYSTYNEYRTKDQKWTKYSNEITGRNAIDRMRWDCIILQQSVEHLDDFDNLEVFADLLNGYITFPVKYLYNMGQARGATDDTWLPSHYTGDTMAERSDKHFADIADYAERALAGCIISEVIPSATAVQNARTTDLSQYGESGNLCKDTASHLQNGIGILTAGYAAAYRILEVLGKYGKIYGAKLTPTDTWVTNTNVPSTMHGDCVGITDENRLLGMKCAMMAIKKPFEITDCSNI